MPSVAEVQDARAVVNRLAAAYELFAAAAIPDMPCLVNTSPYRHIGFGICAAGRDNAHYTIDPDGKVRPCNHSATVLGDLHTQTWQRYWMAPRSPNSPPSHPISAAHVPASLPVEPAAAPPPRSASVPSQSPSRGCAPTWTASRLLPPTSSRYLIPTSAFLPNRLWHGRNRTSVNRPKNLGTLEDNQRIGCAGRGNGVVTARLLLRTSPARHRPRTGL